MSIDTHYWDKYQTITKYSLPLILDDSSIDYDMINVGGYFDGEDEEGRSWGVNSYYPNITAKVDEDTGEITFSSSATVVVYAATLYAPSMYKNKTDYNGTCYCQFGSAPKYQATRIGIDYGGWPGGHATFYGAREIIGATENYSRGTLIQQNITSSVSNTYPSNGRHTDRYWYTKSSKIDHAQGAFIQIVTAKSNSYPSNGYQSGYYYVYLDMQNNKGAQDGSVSSENASAYPADGASGSYWYTSTANTSEAGNLLEIVRSQYEDTYPDNGIKDGYWYIKI